MPLLKTSESAMMVWPPNKVLKTLFAALQSDPKIFKTRFFLAPLRPGKSNLLYPFIATFSGGLGIIHLVCVQKFLKN